MLQQPLGYFAPNRDYPLVRPRRSQAAVGLLLAATLAVNGVLVALIHFGNLFDRNNAVGYAALAGDPICNLVVLSAAFALLPVVRRQSGGALVSLYVVSAIGVPLVAMVIEFLVVAFLDGPKS